MWARLDRRHHTGSPPNPAAQARDAPWPALCTCPEAPAPPHRGHSRLPPVRPAQGAGGRVPAEAGDAGAGPGLAVTQRGGSWGPLTSSCSLSAAGALGSFLSLLQGPACFSSPAPGPSADCDRR